MKSILFVGKKSNPSCVVHFERETTYATSIDIGSLRVVWYISHFCFSWLAVDLSHFGYSRSFFIDSLSTSDSKCLYYVYVLYTHTHIEYERRGGCLCVRQSLKVGGKQWLTSAKRSLALFSRIDVQQYMWHNRDQSLEGSIERGVRFWSAPGFSCLGRPTGHATRWTPSLASIVTTEGRKNSFHTQHRGWPNPENCWIVTATNGQFIAI